ncbi:MAG: hypothetical protein QM831_21450 [Kofleriaceae bacterium]
MQELIEVIRVAVATDASAEQKASGVQACRTIAAALGTEPGKTIMLPGMPLPVAGSRVSVDQMLDLMIARLTTIASQRETEPAPTVVRSTRGLRVPTTPAALPRPVAKQAKRINQSGRKP